MTSVLIQASIDGNGKRIGDMLRKHPHVRKPTVEDCFDFVRQGSAVYIEVMNKAKKVIVL